MKYLLIASLLLAAFSLPMPHRYHAYLHSHAIFDSIMSKSRLIRDSIDLTIEFDSPTIRVGKEYYTIDTALYYGDSDAVFYVRQNRFNEYRFDLDKDRRNKGNYKLGISPIPQSRGVYQFFDMRPDPHANVSGKTQ